MQHRILTNIDPSVFIFCYQTEDHRMESVTELIQTEKKYNERMKDLVNVSPCVIPFSLTNPSCRTCDGSCG